MYYSCISTLKFRKIVRSCMIYFQMFGFPKMMATDSNGRRHAKTFEFGKVFRNFSPGKTFLKLFSGQKFEVKLLALSGRCISLHHQPPNIFSSHHQQTLSYLSFSLHRICYKFIPPWLCKTKAE